MLPLVIGSATRLAQFYTRSDKIYEGVVRFGWSTDTYDRAGEATSEKREMAIDPAELEALLEPLPRRDSCRRLRRSPRKRSTAKRAYELARAIGARWSWRR